MSHTPHIMGIINITPDSFSDGGKFTDPELAYQQALKLIEQGCSILDLGAESSGPNSENVPLNTEILRLEPVLKLFQEKGINKKAIISIDTYKSEVAELGFKYGASMINDVTGLRGDPEMAKTIAANPEAAVIIMYSKDDSARTTKAATQYDDIIATIKEFLKSQTDYAIAAGIKPEKIIIDPGMGTFLSSEPKYSFEVLERLAELHELGFPILIGTSRKSFLGGPVEQRDFPSLMADSIAIRNGAAIVRTHNPANHAAMIADVLKSQ